MTNEPLISVVVPVYNCEKYLSHSVEALLNQSYKNLEIVMVNDGSTDNTLKICHEYRKIDSRIIVVDKKHGGTADTRNVGINAINGDYIGFVDADDYIEENMYELLMNDCLSSGKDIACCNRINLYNDKQNLFTIVSESVIMDSKDAVKTLLVANDFSLCNKLFNKKLFDNLKFVENVTYEDMIPAVQTVMYSNGVYFDSSYLYYYVQNMDSMTHRPFEPTKLDYMLNMNKMADLVKETYNDMGEQCDACCINAITGLIPDVYVVRKQYPEEYRTLLKELEKYKNSYKDNPFVNRNNRIKTFLNIHGMTGLACFLGNLYASIKG